MSDYKYKIGDKVKLVRNFYYSGDYMDNDTGHPGFPKNVGKTFTIKSRELNPWRGNDGIHYHAYLLNETGYRWAEPMFELAFDLNKVKKELAEQGYRVVPARSGKIIVVEYKGNIYYLSDGQWNDTIDRKHYRILTTVDWVEDQ